MTVAGWIIVSVFVFLTAALVIGLFFWAAVRFQWPGWRMTNTLPGNTRLPSSLM